MARRGRFVDSGVQVSDAWEAAAAIRATLAAANRRGADRIFPHGFLLPVPIMRDSMQMQAVRSLKLTLQREIAGEGCF